MGGGDSNILKFSDTLVLKEKRFTDTEFFDYIPKTYDKKSDGIVSYIWSKRYGLLQYTTADSLVWTRINIEEPEE